MKIELKASTVIVSTHTSHIMYMLIKLFRVSNVANSKLFAKWNFGQVINLSTMIVKKLSQTPCTAEKDTYIYDSFSDVGEIRVYWRADFQSGSRVLKKVF